jgi:hypothetical protein
LADSFRIVGHFRMIKDLPAHLPKRKIV